MNERLLELERELAKGQEQMRWLESKRHALRDTLLRIEGAIEVLRELGEAAGGDPTNEAPVHTEAA